MGKFIIEGEKELSGEIEVFGSKNAAGPFLMASLLTEEDCYISNLPKISDIEILLEILEEMGARIVRISERAIKINTKNVDPVKIDFDKASKLRLSVLLIGALLNRFKNFKVPKPGGDRIGLRPITTHIDGFKELNVEIEEDTNFYYIKSKELKPNKIVLKEFSVTATENLLLASALIKGTTVIKCAALEPHVQSLVNFLNKMGAEIKILNDHTFKIVGAKKLKGVKMKVIPDTNEVATFSILGALLGKNLVVKNVVPEHLEIFWKILKDIGGKFELFKNKVVFNKNKEFFPTKVQALPYPGFPTDVLPVFAVLLTKAKGKSLIHDPLYENRLNYIQELRKMGADMEIVDPHRAFVFGPTILKGARLISSDIRAGASLVIAGLIAKGTTIVEGIEQIDRGYENLDKRLQKIGAFIKRE
jgi:UDP-N-acetylglucosamine 1-carboxyvinyltransferase